MFCCVVISWVLLRVVPYFDEPVGQVRIQTMSKNTLQYYSTKCLILRDLSSNRPNCYVCGGKFHRYLFTGNVWQKYAKQNGIGVENPANWLVKSRRTRQTGFCGFDQAITGAIYFTFHKGKTNRLSTVKPHIDSSFSL